jgi:hypothetical protein
MAMQDACAQLEQELRTLNTENEEKVGKMSSIHLELAGTRNELEGLKKVHAAISEAHGLHRATNKRRRGKGMAGGGGVVFVGIGHVIRQLT